MRKLLPLVVLLSGLLACPVSASDEETKKNTTVQVQSPDGVREVAVEPTLFGRRAREEAARAALAHQLGHMYAEQCKQTELLRIIAHGQMHQTQLQAQQGAEIVQGLRQLPATGPIDPNRVPQLPATGPADPNLIPRQPATGPVDPNTLPQLPATGPNLTSVNYRRQQQPARYFYTSQRRR